MHSPFLSGEASRQHQNVRRPNAGRRLMACGLLVGNLLTAPQMHPSVPLNLPQPAPRTEVLLAHPAPPIDQQSTFPAAVDAQAMQVGNALLAPGSLGLVSDKVNQVLQQDETATIINANDPLEHPWGVSARELPPLPEDLATIRLSVDEKLAEQYGLTFRSADAYVEDYNHALGEGGHSEAELFGLLFSGAQRYLATRNVSLTIADPSDKMLDAKQNTYAPTASDLYTQHARTVLMEILQEYVALPQQFLDFADGGKGQTLTLYAGPKSTHGAFTITDGDHNHIWYNISDYVPLNLKHEISHDADAAEAGGAQAMSNDPDFADLNRLPYNPANYDATTSAYDQLDTVDTYEETFQDLVANELDYLSANNQAAACQAEASVQAYAAEAGPAASFSTSYSKSNVVEQKAEIDKEMLTPEDWQPLLRTDLKAIRNELALSLGRLARFLPSYALYLANNADAANPLVYAIPDCTDPSPYRKG